MSTIRHSRKTSAFCYVTIRCPLLHKICWNRVIFEDQKPYFTGLVEKWIENASMGRSPLYSIV